MDDDWGYPSDLGDLGNLHLYPTNDHLTPRGPGFFSHLDVAKPHWRPNKSGRPWGQGGSPGCGISTDWVPGILPWNLNAMANITYQVFWCFSKHPHLSKKCKIANFSDDRNVKYHFPRFPRNPRLRLQQERNLPRGTSWFSGTIIVGSIFFKVIENCYRWSVNTSVLHHLS